LTIAAPEPVSNTNASGHTIYSNENITRLDHELVIENSGLPPTWQDTKKLCSSSFRCITIFSTGWDDKKSIQILTTNRNSNTFLNIIGDEVPISPKK
jgi:hypothetical protein